MKYCPNCGAQLPDEARFCTSCGSKQPDAPGVAQPQPQAQPQPAQVTQPVNQEKSPRERYSELYKNDEVFREIVNVRRKKYLFELIFAVCLISWIVCMFTPVALFNGNNATSEGAMIMSSLGKALPYKTNAYDLIALDAAAGNKALTPGGLGSVFAGLFMFFGPVIIALSVALPLIKAFTGRGYVLKTYEAGKVKELIKETIQPFWAGGAFSLIMIVPALNLFISSNGEEYKDGKTYLFGEIESIPSNFVVVIIVVVLLTAASIAATAVIGNLISKKLKEYAKNM